MKTVEEYLDILNQQTGNNPHSVSYCETTVLLSRLCGIFEVEITRVKSRKKMIQFLKAYTKGYETGYEAGYIYGYEQSKPSEHKE